MLWKEKKLPRMTIQRIISTMGAWFCGFSLDFLEKGAVVPLLTWCFQFAHNK